MRNKLTEKECILCGHTSMMWPQQKYCKGSNKENRKCFVNRVKKVLPNPFLEPPKMGLSPRLQHLELVLRHNQKARNVRIKKA